MRTVKGLWVQARNMPLVQLSAHLDERLHVLGLHDVVDQWVDDEAFSIHLALTQEAFERLTPGHDTVELTGRCPNRPVEGPEAISWEVWVAWLCSPIELRFDSWEDLQSAERIRHNLCANASQTSLDFRTEDASRPESHWIYRDDCGYVLLPDVDLVEALVLATQPERSGSIYAFSCYRATEYVILLSIAQEAKVHNPQLYERLQQQWRTKAISSKLFHASFLHEVGEVQAPLPMTWYVPGDRVWFKNPNPLSSDVTGYEGSWVIYLGGGRFCNFWNHHRPYSLDSKCVELFHWQHAYRINRHGAAHIDEDLVTQLTQQSLSNAQERQAILDRMKRYRDPAGVYGEGGCIDSTREIPRKILPHHCEVILH